MKKCSKCKIEKNLDEFWSNKNKKDGKFIWCIECGRKQNKITKNRYKSSIIKDISKKICCSCKIEKNTSKFGKDKNSPTGYNYRCLKCSAKYQRENRNKEYSKNYPRENRIKINKRQRQRYKEDIQYRLRSIISTQIGRGLKKRGYSKNCSFLKKVDYSMKQLKEHLEDQFDENMTWENYGSYWHIDHIKPHSFFEYDSMDHPNFKKCWALENLRPLEAIENIKKGNKILFSEDKRLITIDKTL